jgi:phage baseplate assembly protein W
MQTISIVDGDFDLSGGTFKTITGATKIQQDMGIASLTPYGSNKFHPKYGSVLQSMIGHPTNSTTQSLIQSEITRLINNYQNIQIRKMNAYILQGLRSPYGQDDLIQSVQSINVTQNFDSFNISVILLTMSGQAIPIGSTISSAQSPVGS